MPNLTKTQARRDAETLDAKAAREAWQARIDNAYSDKKALKLAGGAFHGFVECLDGGDTVTLRVVDTLACQGVGRIVYRDARHRGMTGVYPPCKDALLLALEKGWSRLEEDAENR